LEGGIQEAIIKTEAGDQNGKHFENGMDCT
jgi:hypothetical protein